MIVTAYNTYQYKIRYGGEYCKYREYYRQANNLTVDQLKNEFEKRKQQFLCYAKNNSKWYKQYNSDEFESVPVLERKILLKT